MFTESIYFTYSLIFLFAGFTGYFTHYFIYKQKLKKISERIYELHAKLSHSDSEILDLHRKIVHPNT